MADTLRNIVEGTEHDVIEVSGWRSGTTKPHGKDNISCLKCRLLALLDAAEKMDLVEKWREIAETLETGFQTEYGSTGAKARESARVRRQCADELREWLAARGIWT